MFILQMKLSFAFFFSCCLAGEVEGLLSYYYIIVKLFLTKVFSVVRCLVFNVQLKININLIFRKLMNHFITHHCFT